MKKITLLLLLLSCTIPFLHAQDCNIGNNNGDFILDQSSNYLLGIQHSLTENGVLHSINMKGTYTGTNIQMAVYTDNGGAPGDLVIASGTALVVGGTVSLPVTATQLYPGNYWIMAVYDSNGEPTFGTLQTTLVYYKYFAFGGSMPSTLTGTTSYYSDYEMSYSLEISCGTLGTEDENILNQVRLYPNPNKGIVHLDLGNLTNVNIKVYNTIGQKVYSVDNIMDASHQFEVSTAAGFYFVEVTSGHGKQILKLIKE